MVGGLIEVLAIGVREDVSIIKRALSIGLEGDFGLQSL